jgi:hypothetical protein
MSAKFERLAGLAVLDADVTLQSHGFNLTDACWPIRCSPGRRIFSEKHLVASIR